MSNGKRINKDAAQEERLRRAKVQQAEVRLKYGRLFQEVSGLLFMADPIGLNYEDNTDEYDAEAGTIIARLHECRDAEEVWTVVFEEYVRWFGPRVAGPRERYREVSVQIWEAWRRVQAK